MKNIFVIGTNHRFTNADITAERFELKESICSSASLQFGLCEATEIKLQVRCVDPLINEEFNLTIDGTAYNGYTCIKDEPTADKVYRDIVLVDRMYKVLNTDVLSWYNGLSYPLSLKQFRDSFFNYLGITQKSVTLINDGMSIEKTVYSNRLYGKEIIRNICELNGCFGHMARNGAFDYVFLGGEETEITLYKSAKYSDYVTDLITCVQIRQDNGDIGAVVGSSGNDLIIEGNFLCYGKSSDDLATIAGNLLGAVDSVVYRPFTAVMPTDFSVELGQAVVIPTKSCDIASYVLERTVKGIQAMFDTLSAKGTEKLPTKANGVNYDIQQLKGKSNELQREIDVTRLTIADVESGLKSEIAQTADGLSVQIEHIQEEIDGEIKTYNVSVEPTLYNYPAYNFTDNIRVGETFILNPGLKFEYTDEGYSKRARTVAFNETDFTSYRFLKKDGVWQWVAIADSDFALLKKEIAEVKVTTNSITQEVSTIETSLEGNYYKKAETDAKIQVSSSGILQTVSATYTTKDYVNGGFETKEHAESTYQQTADQIKTTVKKGSIISEINQTAEKVTISAGKIDLNGLVNASQFTSKFATIESLNATNLAVSGKLEASQFTAQNISALGITVSSAHVTGGFDASKITSGYISADRINADVINACLQGKNVRSYTLHVDTSIEASTYRYHLGNNQYANMYLQTVTIAGKTYQLLGRQV